MPRVGGCNGGPSEGGFNCVPRTGGFNGVPRVGGFSGVPSVGGLRGIPRVCGFNGELAIPKVGGPAKLGDLIEGGVKTGFGIDGGAPRDGGLRGNCPAAIKLGCLIVGGSDIFLSRPRQVGVAKVREEDGREESNNDEPADEILPRDEFAVNGLLSSALVSASSRLFAFPR